MPISDCDARLNDFNVMFSHRAVRLSACDVILIIMVSGLMAFDVMFSHCVVRRSVCDTRFSDCRVRFSHL